MYSSVREIRIRLLSLLVRVFVFVLLLSLIFFLVVVGSFLTSQTSPISIPFSGALEGYYIGHGSLNGVEIVFEEPAFLTRLHRVGGVTGVEPRADSAAIAAAGERSIRAAIAP